MALPKGENPNRPEPGSTIKVEPIRDVKAIRRIKMLLVDQERDLCLFTFGINTAYRANEILSVKVGQVAHMKTGDVFDLKQRKTKKYRSVTMNKTVIDAIDSWLKCHPRSLDDNAPLFIGQRGNQITVSYTNNLVKQWCQDVGLKGNYGSHTLRKTWGYQQRVQRNTPIPLLMDAYGHTTQKQTLEYLCIQAEEISELFDMEL
ncbi:MAG: tyrosine-type recombinase/integrase [Candidatus Thiodiazotropha sp. (ex Lucinoma kastoroae)]|nr:tyrosine-type recombinase/integrase [Candidatus Thiodiazotropha sp. (ex Lucinoma kastoroae)]